MLSDKNRALVERFMDAGCYRPTDTTFGFTDRRLNELLDAAREEARDDAWVDASDQARIDRDRYA